MLYTPRVIKTNEAHGIYSPLNAYGIADEIEKIAPSEWIQRLLNLRVQGGTVPFSLAGRDYLRPIYDNGYRQIVLLTGRQVEKSTTLAAKLFGWMTKIDNFRAVYAGPDDHTIKTFCESRLSDFIDSSPLLNEYFMNGPSAIRNTGIIKMVNGSVTYLKNSARQGANFRGLTADAFMVDEMQGMMEEVVPVGLECLSHGNAKIEMYCGTPLTMHNFAQKQWKKSTQNEWLIPCSHCNGALISSGVTGRHQYYVNIGVPNLTPTGLICDKCGGRIHASAGSWVQGSPGKRIEGFRIPQPIGEWANFEQIYFDKVKEYPLAQLMNEVLGISYDSAAIFLTEEEVFKRCESHLSLKTTKTRDMKGLTMVAGVDWGHANTPQGGKTVLTIFSIDPQHGFMNMVFGRIYPDTISKNAQVRHMISMLRAFDVNVCCADEGANGSRNELLAEAIGGNKLTQIQYVGGSSYVHYQNVTGIYRIGKTPSMNTFYNDFVTRGQVRLVKREEFEPLFAEQMMGAGKEINHQGNLRYIKMDGDDDFLQATVYANMARRIALGMELVDNIPLSYEMIVRNEDVEAINNSDAMPNW